MFVGIQATLIQSLIALEDSIFFHAFLWMIVIDIFTGLAKSVKEKNMNSSIGLNGLIRHMLIIFIVFLLSVYLPIYDFSTILNWITFYFIIMYVISVFENLEAIGVPLPHFVKDYVTKMHRSMNKEYRIHTKDNVDVTISSKESRE